MKTFFTGQAGVIKTHGRTFAEFVYDEFKSGSAFHARDVNFPPFEGMKSKQLYTRMLLTWMIEQSPEDIRRVGLQCWRVN